MTQTKPLSKKISTNQSFFNLIELLQLRGNLKNNNHRHQTPSYTFLANGERETAYFTYQELHRQAKLIAIKLQSLIKEGERVLLIYPAGLDFIAAFFGCIYAGVMAIPVNVPKKSQKMVRLEGIIEDAKPQAILTTNNLLPKIEDKLNQIIKSESIHYLTTDNLDIDDTYNWQAPIITKDTVAFLQYTSGSTGNPKGVMITHDNILHNAEYIKKSFQCDESTVSVSWLPHFHDMGLIGGILLPLYIGIPVVLMPPESFLQKPIRWLKAISKYKATHSGAPNLGYEACINKITDEEMESLDLSSWRLAYTGSETIRSETLKAFTDKFTSCGFKSNAFYPCYGMAEATLMITGADAFQQPNYLSLDEEALQNNHVMGMTDKSANVKEIVSCGKPASNSEIKIVNPESCEENPPHEVGEIWVSGLNVAQGYWQNQSETNRIFKATLANDKNTFFLRTGDLGFLHDDNLYITGRLKDLIIIRGRNFYPQDIEYNVQNSHQALSLDCGAAFSIEKDNEEKLVIIQELKRNYLRQENFEDIFAAIREVISLEYALQVYSIVLIKTASLPKTSSGKIQRKACRDAFINNNLNVVTKWQQKTEIQELQPMDNQIINEEVIEEWLVSRLAFYLKMDKEEIDIEKPFAYYGLDSSVAITLTNELAEWLNRELEVTLLWEYPNIEFLTQYLSEKY